MAIASVFRTLAPIALQTGGHYLGAVSLVGSLVEHIAPAGTNTSLQIKVARLVASSFITATALAPFASAPVAIGCATVITLVPFLYHVARKNEKKDNEIAKILLNLKLPTEYAILYSKVALVAWAIIAIYPLSVPGAVALGIAGAVQFLDDNMKRLPKGTLIIPVRFKWINFNVEV